MKKGFTLAEVLVTLGIIGVVSALTVPTLMKNHQRKVYVTQLRKSISVLEQGFQMMLNDSNTDSLSETEVFSTIGGQSCIATSGPNSSSCKAFLQSLTKYFQVLTIGTTGEYKYSYIRSGSTPIYPDGTKTSAKMILKDGTMLFRFNVKRVAETPKHDCDTIRNAGGSVCSIIGHFSIDVNGEQKPNIEGRDIFNFNITDDGRVIPFYGFQQAVYIDGVANGSSYWKNATKACGTPGKNDVSSVAQYGSGCAARIMESGWEMDY